MIFGQIEKQNVTAFDDIERENEGPANHLVSQFDYLNNSGRPEAVAIRDLIDTWLTNYPTQNRPDMIQRLRSREDTLHLSAFFELILHALLLQQNFTVVEVEPVLANGKAPDFLVEAPDGTRFYLEATLASGMDNVAAGADRRMREALQAIDNVNSPDFFLHLHTQGIPSQPIKIRLLQSSLQRFVNSLDYRAAVEAAEAGKPPACIWQYDEHGAHFTIRPLPKNTRRADGRAIGGRVLLGRDIRPEIAIRSAVVGKAGRYGETDFPLVIAVNALENFASITDAIDALFGTVSIIVPEVGEPRKTRNPDGAWGGPTKPVYTRSSAVLFVERLSPWSVGQRRLHLILNPWARNPLPELPLGVEVHRAINEELVTQSGQSLAEVFGLPDGWPE